MHHIIEQPWVHNVCKKNRRKKNSLQWSRNICLFDISQDQTKKLDIGQSSPFVPVRVNLSLLLLKYKRYLFQIAIKVPVEII